jgi:hypothetical protein
VHRSCSRTVTLLVLVAFQFLEMTISESPPLASTYRPWSPANVGNALRDAGARAAYVVVGTITDSEGIKDQRGDIVTEFHIRVSEFLKGPPTLDSLLSFTAAGGVYEGSLHGSTSMFTAEVGDQYLLHPEPCNGTDYIRGNTGLAAKIEGDSASTRWPPRTIAEDDLIAEVTGGLLVSDPEWQRANADLVIGGTISDTRWDQTMPRLDAISGEFDVVIGDIYKNGEVPTYDVGDTVTIVVPPYSVRHASLRASLPPLAEDETAVFFLEEVGGDWQLLPTIWSKWRIIGEQAVVACKLGYCSSTVHHQSLDAFVGFLLWGQ